jgi:hypothetical protein
MNRILEVFLPLCLERLSEMTGEFRKQYYAMHERASTDNAAGK